MSKRKKHRYTKAERRKFALRRHPEEEVTIRPDVLEEKVVSKTSALIYSQPRTKVPDISEEGWSLENVGISKDLLNVKSIPFGRKARHPMAGITIADEFDLRNMLL